MIEYRDWAVQQYGLNLIVKINEDARAGRGDIRERGPIGYETTDPGDRHARTEDRRAPAGDGGAQMGRADHRHPPR